MLIDLISFFRRLCRRSVVCLLPWVSVATAAGPTPVVVYGATDREHFADFTECFENRHPGIKIDYRDKNSAQVFERVRSEAAENAEADIVWHPAMDLLWLVLNNGYALSRRSVETEALPAWARWRDEGFGTTYEPIAIACARMVPAETEVPRTHAELLQHREASPADMVTYDPHRSGLGYMLHSQDSAANPVMFWKIVHAMGGICALAETTTNAMLGRIARGESRYGYNVLRSYALQRAATDDGIGVILPRSYTRVLSRVAFISRRAPHPNPASAFLDVMISCDGQTALSRAGLFVVRDDIEVGRSATNLRKEQGRAFRPIALSTGLLAHLDGMERGMFLTRWDVEAKPR